MCHITPSFIPLVGKRRTLSRFAWRSTEMDDGTRIWLWFYDIEQEYRPLFDDQKTYDPAVFGYWGHVETRVRPWFCNWSWEAH